MDSRIKDIIIGFGSVVLFVILITSLPMIIPGPYSYISALVIFILVMSALGWYASERSILAESSG